MGVHRGRVAFPNLERVNVNLLVFAVDFDDHLGRVADALDGVDRVLILQQREICQRLHFVEVRAGDAEKIPEHPIAKPIRREVRQTIEHVKPAQAHSLDDIQDSGEKPLEPFLRVHDADFRARRFIQQRRVPGEPEIDQPSLEPSSLLHIWAQEGNVLFHGIDFPHDIVAGPEVLEDLVEPGDAAAHRGLIVLHRKRRALLSSLATEREAFLRVPETMPRRNEWCLRKSSGPGFHFPRAASNSASCAEISLSEANV